MHNEHLEKRRRKQKMKKKLQSSDKSYQLIGPENRKIDRENVLLFAPKQIEMNKTACDFNLFRSSFAISHFAFGFEFIFEIRIWGNLSASIELAKKASTRFQLLRVQSTAILCINTKSKSKSFSPSLRLSIGFFSKFSVHSFQSVCVFGCKYRFGGEKNRQVFPDW